MAEQPSPAAGDSTDKRLPHQMDVYFERYPQLDLDQLASFVSGCEPDAAEACEVRQAGEDQQNEQGLRVGAFIAAQGSMTIAALVHSTPSPAGDVIEHCGLPEKTRAELLGHGSWALLTLLGGDDLPPVDRTLFLYKVATGLCLQGGIGVANLYTRIVLPGGALRKLFEHPLPDAQMTRWDILRRHGEPAELLVRFGGVELQGRRYLATCGFAYCGLPDLLWEYTTREDAADVAKMFRNCFTYLMGKGPVIKAGHTIGYDEKVAFRFSTPPAGLELPYPSEQVLLITKETKR
jgi:Domain of unknown function (DUF4261)